MYYTSDVNQILTIYYQFNNQCLNNKFLQNNNIIITRKVNNNGMLEEYLLDLHHKFYIIAIPETLFKSSSDLSFLQLDGYDMNHLDRGNKNGGLVAMYIQNTPKYSIIKHMTYAMDDVLECPSVEVMLHKKNIAILCLYKHPTCTIDK